MLYQSLDAEISDRIPLMVALASAGRLSKSADVQRLCANKSTFWPCRPNSCRKISISLIDLRKGETKAHACVNAWLRQLTLTTRWGKCPKSVLTGCSLNPAGEIQDCLFDRRTTLSGGIVRFSPESIPLGLWPIQPKGTPHSPLRGSERYRLLTEIDSCSSGGDTWRDDPEQAYHRGARQRGQT